MKKIQGYWAFVQLGQNEINLSNAYKLQMKEYVNASQ